MNWNQIEGNGRQLKGNVQQQWAKFTNDDLVDGEYSNGNTEHANKFGYDDTIKDNSANETLGMQDGKQCGTQGGGGDNNKDSEGPGDGEGIPGTGESDEMDDSGKPIPNPMPDDLDEPAHAKDRETPHQEKSLDQT